MSREKQEPALKRTDSVAEQSGSGKCKCPKWNEFQRESKILLIGLLSQ